MFSGTPGSCDDKIIRLLRWDRSLRPAELTNQHSKDVRWIVLTLTSTSAVAVQVKIKPTLCTASIPRKARTMCNYSQYCTLQKSRCTFEGTSGIKSGQLLPGAVKSISTHVKASVSLESVRIAGCGDKKGCQLGLSSVSACRWPTFVPNENEPFVTSYRNVNSIKGFSSRN